MLFRSADVVAHSVALLQREAAARATVDSLPVLPTTSSFLALSVPAPSPQGLQAAVEGLFGTVAKSPPASLAPLHVHSPHCEHADPSPPVVYGLIPAQAVQLQVWLPGRPAPHTWAEVYRGSRDGFKAATFHRLCDDKPRLLFVVRDKESGWLFGGFTALGFLKGGNRW